MHEVGKANHTTNFISRHCAHHCIHQYFLRPQILSPGVGVVFVSLIFFMHLTLINTLFFLSGPEPFSVTEFDLVLFNDTHNHNFLILGQDVFLYLASSELKTLEWDILNPDRIINLEIKNERRTSNT